MFRSLITLLLLATLTTAPLTTAGDSVFSEKGLLEVQSIPVKSTDAIEPVVEAKAALLMDLDSGIVMFEKNSAQQMPMASLTKIIKEYPSRTKHGWCVTVTDRRYKNTGPIPIH